MKAIFMFILISLFTFGCELLIDEEDEVGRKSEESYMSSNGAVIVTIKYYDYDDLDKKYEAYGEAVDKFSEEIEQIIADNPEKWIVY